MTKNSLAQQRAAVNKKKLLQTKPVVSEPFCCGQAVAIVRTDTGKLVAIAKVDKVTDRYVRTETPYDQRRDHHELSRRHWRAAEPFNEMRVPREEKGTRPPCVIRLVTREDVALAERLAEARRAKRRLPYDQRNKAEYERRIALAEAAVHREREPYERLLGQMEQDARLIAEFGEEM